MAELVEERRWACTTALHGDLRLRNSGPAIKAKLHKKRKVIAFVFFMELCFYSATKTVDHQYTQNTGQCVQVDIKRVVHRRSKR